MDIEQKKQLRTKILRRVYRSWLIRRSAPLIVIEILIGWIAFTIFLRYVFVEKVISNALLASLGNPIELFIYGVAAFIATSTIIKIIIIIGLAFLLLLMRDVNRSLIARAAMKREEMMR